MVSNGAQLMFQAALGVCAMYGAELQNCTVCQVVAYSKLWIHSNRLFQTWQRLCCVVFAIDSTKNQIHPTWMEFRWMTLYRNYFGNGIRATVAPGVQPRCTVFFGPINRTTGQGAIDWLQRTIQCDLNCCVQFNKYFCLSNHIRKVTESTLFGKVCPVQGTQTHTHTGTATMVKIEQSNCGQSVRCMEHKSWHSKRSSAVVAVFGDPTSTNFTVVWNECNSRGPPKTIY